MHSKIHQHYYGLDVAKLVAAVFVISAHTHPLTNLDGTQIYKIWNFFEIMAVLFFALVSGYLLSRKLQWSGDSKEDIQILKKTLFSLVRLYLIWNLIYFPIAIQEPVPDSKPLYLIMLRYVINFFFVGEHYLSWQLWYLLANIYGVVLIIFLRKWKGKPWLLGLFSLMLLYFSQWVYQFVSNPSLYTGIVHTISVLMGEIFINGRLFEGMSYILAGALFGRFTRFPKPFSCFVVFAAASLHVLNIFQTIPVLKVFLTPICACFLFFLCLHWKGTQPKAFYLACRKISTVFYFTHMLWFYVGYLLLDPIPSFTYWGFPAFLTSLFGCCMTAVVVLKFQKAKLVKMLF